MTLLNLCVGLALLALLFWSPHASPEQIPPDAGPHKTAEGLVGALYEAVTFEAGTTPDWNRVRAMFIDEAVIVLRTSRENTSVFSVEGFVDDFIKFIERANARETGFVERIIRKKSMVFGDMAHVLVLYEASIPGSPRPPQKGVDSFSLIRKDGRWWIVAVTNEVPTPDRPLPQGLRD
ncbi:MAG: nuclear transport factor 2 family protein [Planctomycetota bacterium]|jgi:hypothetical protein